MEAVSGWAILNRGSTGWDDFLVNPPAGPVRELWHIEHPLNESVPFPKGVVSMEQWSQTVITMQKYAGDTFGQLLDAIKAGDRDVIQYSSWLVHTYSRHITKTPKSQAPDLSACQFHIP